MLRCPACGSPDLYEMIGGYGGFRYRCKQCGYIGSFVVESDDPLPPPAAVQECEKGETKFTVPLWLKIAAALLLLFLFLMRAIF